MKISLKLVPKKSNWQYLSTHSSDGLVPTGRQVFTQANVDFIQFRSKRVSKFSTGQAKPYMMWLELYRN